MTRIRLPDSSGRMTDHTLGDPVRVQPRAGGDRPRWNRIAYAAAHVVANPLVEHDPWLDAPINWDATIAYRRHLWSLGFAVAEAMDTAQRGMGLDWKTSLQLIARSVQAARDTPGAQVASGCGTDHLTVTAGLKIDDVIRAYEEQLEAIEKLGGRTILMASRALAAIARSPDDYARVYDRVLSQMREPTIIHWLGDMFDPALAGYWGHRVENGNATAAMDVAVDIINRNAAKVDGVKISLLDAGAEIRMRRRLAPGVRMYTGDDFNFAELIAGDEQGHSDALLGIFDAIAPVAAAAFDALAAGDRAGYDRLLAPTVPLSRHIFKAPTRFYKTGIVFLAWLNGHQRHFTMVGGQQSARSALHLAELVRLADKAGLLADPPLAAKRCAQLFATLGFE